MLMEDYLNDLAMLENIAIKQQVKEEDSAMVELLKMAKSLIPDNDSILLFYPKNLFNKKAKSLYLFSKNQKLIEIECKLEEGVIANIFDFNQINKFSIETVEASLGVEDLQLILEFYNRNHMIFIHSRKDSNDAWRDEYQKHILKIAKLFV